VSFPPVEEFADSGDEFSPVWVDEVLMGALKEKSAILGAFDRFEPPKRGLRLSIRCKLRILMIRRVWQPLHDFAARRGAWCQEDYWENY